MNCDASHRKMFLRSSSRSTVVARFALAGVAVVSLVSLSLARAGAQMLPATAPTTLPSKNALPAPIAASPDGHSSSAAPANPVKSPGHRASVTYASGMLDVRADDSSLNQILREIARQTGMKITGGVADQRVFGNYGPAEPSTILATLLDGTGSNMLLRETADNSPAELILTPRNGGATPPNPNAPGFDDDPDDDSGGAKTAMRARPGVRGFGAGSPSAGMMRNRAVPTQGGGDGANLPQQMQKFSGQPLPSSATPAASSPVSIPQPLNNINGSPDNSSPTASTYPVTDSVPTDSLPTPSTTPSTSGIVDAPNPPAPGGTTASSLTPTGNVEVPATVDAGTATGGTAPDPSQPGANAPATPEQIFQQLQALRAQQSGGSTTPAPK